LGQKKLIFIIIVAVVLIQERIYRRIRGYTEELKMESWKKKTLRRFENDL
jgi:hypothetical protein